MRRVRWCILTATATKAPRCKHCTGRHPPRRQREPGSKTVCYLTRRCTIACEPDACLVDAPLNTTSRADVTCGPCRATPDYQAGAVK